MDEETLPAMPGHVSATTTLDIYTYITNDMHHTAAVNIDRGIGKRTPPEDGEAPISAQPEKPGMTDFKPCMGTR